MATVFTFSWSWTPPPPHTAHRLPNRNWLTHQKIFYRFAFGSDGQTCNIEYCTIKSIQFSKRKAAVKCLWAVINFRAKIKNNVLNYRYPFLKDITKNTKPLKLRLQIFRNLKMLIIFWTGNKKQKSCVVVRASTASTARSHVHGAPVLSRGSVQPRVVLPPFLSLQRNPESSL